MSCMSFDSSAILRDCDSRLESFGFVEQVDVLTLRGTGRGLWDGGGNREKREGGGMRDVGCEMRGWRIRWGKG